MTICAHPDDPDTPEEVAVRVLGPFQITAAQMPLPVTPGQQALLSVLFLFPGRPCGHDLLFRSLWGPRWPADPRSALDVAVSRARTALRAVPGARITARPGSYQVHVPDGVLDLQLFRSKRARARIEMTSGSLAHAASLLQKALSYWQSPDLDSIPGLPPVPEVDAEAVGLLEERHISEHDLADIRLRLGHHQQILPDLRARTITHPDCEQAAAQLMYALCMAGRPLEALTAFGALQQVLELTYGTEPGPAVQQLLRLIRSGRTPALPGSRPSHRADCGAAQLAPGALMRGATA